MARADAAFRRALDAHARGLGEESRRHCEQALALRAGHLGALQLLAVIALQGNEPARALETLERALELGSASAPIHHNHGTALYMLGRFEAALAAYDRAVALQPHAAGSHEQRGNALYALGRFEAAVEAFGRAFALDASLATAHHNHGIALAALGRHDAAIASYDEAIRRAPDYTDAYRHRGNALFALQRFAAALSDFSQVVARRPRDAGAYNDQAKTLTGLGRYAEALAAFDAALALAPEDADIHANRGGALLAAERFADAVASFDRAIASRGGFAAALCSRGDALFRLHRFEAAIESYDLAIAADPDRVDAHQNRGNALRELLRWPEAIASYDRALALRPGTRALQGIVLNARLRICDWSDFDLRLERLCDGIRGGAALSTPFCLLTLIDAPALQRSATEMWAREAYPPDPVLGAPPPRAVPPGLGSEPIRLGYFTADCHEHATMHLLVGLLERHDAGRFAVTVFSFGPPRHDAMRARVERVCEVLDVHAETDLEVARLARRRAIDIAVDLKGFTQDARPGIFALRAAPVQIAFLGYPGTLGVEYMDYLIADRHVVPEGGEVHYREKLICLPDSYQPNDDRRPIGAHDFTRVQLGLPSTGFVFCCFNNNYKILPAVFDVWMRLLLALPDSVLWLLEDNPVAAANLRDAARARGVEAGRLVFAPRMPMPEHLARQRAADLFLDTLPCNAHTTASDALWAGLPLLTCAGAGFAARVAASLLHAVGLDDLVTTTLDRYEALALALARDAPRLAALRARLARNLRTTALFDTLRYTRGLETEYARLMAAAAA